MKGNLSQLLHYECGIRIENDLVFVRISDEAFMEADVRYDEIRKDAASRQFE